MTAFSSHALFCEDIREEASGQVSLVGIMPDRARVEPRDPSKPPVLPKLGLYVRTSIPPHIAMDHPFQIVMRSPSGQLVVENPIDPTEFREQVDEAIAMDAPIFTMVTRILMPTFPVLEWGRFEVWTGRAAEETLAGYLHFENSSDEVSAVPPAQG